MAKRKIDDQEEDFPRGGKHALSAAEIYEVRAEAEAEFNREADNSERKKKRRKVVNKEPEGDEVPLEKGPVSVDHLNLSKIAPGMRILGAVSEIKKDLSISLPCGLHGFVKANEALELMNLESKEVNNLLKERFRVGQYVSCTVLSLEQEHTDVKGQRRAVLSLLPRRFNEGITIDAVHVGQFMIASVKSTEDHGYILSFGVDGVSGFLLHKDHEGDKLGIGQILQASVSTIDKKRGVVNLSTRDLSSTIKEHENISLGSLVPGALVNGRIRSVLRNGLFVSFITYFTGIVDRFHLDSAFSKPKDYTKDKRLKARIVLIDPATKNIRLSLRPHIVNFETVTPIVNRGDIFNCSIIKRIDPAIGLLLELPTTPPTPGYVNQSNVDEKRIEKLEKKFKEGQQVKARTLGFNIMDGMATLSMKELILKGVMSKTDLQPGIIVHGRVTKVENHSLSVHVGEARAYCAVRHMTEFFHENQYKKFQVGDMRKFRVLGYDRKNRCWLTLKKSLVTSNLPLITSFDADVVGLVTHGCIVSITSFGCFVEFYNQVSGLVHKSDSGLDHNTPLESAFKVGQVVKCKVLSIDSSTQRMNLSFNISSEGSGLEPGSLISATIRTMSPSHIILQADKLAVTMAYAHLSDTPAHVEQMQLLLKPGFKFDRLLVLGQENSKTIVTAKHSLVEAAKSLPSSLEQITPETVLPGYIKNTQKSCLVGFLDKLRGFVPMAHTSDAYVEDISQVYFVGQSVRAHVLEVDLEKDRLILSLRQSACFSTDVTLIKGYFQEEEMIAKLKEIEWSDKLQIGEIVAAEVQEIKDYGVIFNLKGNTDVVGFATHYQTDGKVEVGSSVKACILDVVKTDGIVDLSLHRKMLNAKKEKAVPQIHQRVEVVVELVKDEYLVLSLPNHEHAIGFASTRDYNIRMLRPHDLYSPGQKLSATIFSSGPESVGGRILLLLADVKPPSFAYVKNDIGSIVEGQIQEISSLHMIIQLGNRLRGNVSVTEILDQYEEGNPLKKYRAGQAVRAKIISKRKTNRKHSNAATLDLSLRPSEIAGNDSAGSVITLETVTSGQAVVGYVQQVTDDWAWLLLSSHVRARLHILDSSTDPAELERFTERFRIGDAFQCYVKSVNHEKEQVDLSLRATNLDEDGKHFKKGDLVGGRIRDVRRAARGLIVGLDSNTLGMVHVTHLGDTWMDFPEKLFTKNKFVRCRVLDVSEKRLCLSLRPSLGGIGGFESLPSFKALDRKSTARIVNSVSEIVPDMQVQAYVNNVSNRGCFVELSPALSARVLLKELSASFVKDPAAVFPAGKLVEGRIVSVEPLSGRIEMTLVIPSAKDPTSSKDLQVGDVVSGRIRRLEPYGIFIDIDEGKGNVVGLCHVSQVSDGFIEDLSEVYRVGQRVQAKVLKIDPDQARVSLGMKASYLAESFTPEEAIEPKNVEVPANETVQMEIEEDDNDLNLDTEAAPMETDVDPLEVNLDEDADEKSASEDEKPATAEETKKKNKREKKRLKEEREAAVRAAEERLLQKDQPPETEDDFERLVAESPNSSYIWIKYMAYWLRLADPDRARAVAERALETVNYREELEKMNIWTAYLNLENSYAASPREAVSSLFERALKYCDPKKLHLALFGVYESTNQHDLLDALAKSMTRKFKTSSKVWLRHLSNLLSRKLSDKARKAFEQACIALPRHKHIKFISRAAILEFKSGSPERAREIFDGVLRNYPKRTDLWSVYLDQEIRLGDVAVTRDLFERSTCLDLPAKKMKFLFKKYLDYEKAHGDETRIEHVKTKAMEFVEAKTG